MDVISRGISGHSSIMYNALTSERASYQHVHVLTIIIACQFGTVSLFSMLSRNQQLILDPGDGVSLQCEFYMERFNLFYNPILWRKVQYDESSELNIMGNIKDPFDETDKFKVSFNPLPPRYMLGLDISNVTYGDSGNYTCEVRGPASELLGLVIYSIFIRAPVVDVALHKERYSGKPSELEQLETQLRVSFIENYPAPVVCMVHGGNPPPLVELTIGHQDVTDMFTIERYRKRVGEPGFRIVQLTTVLWTDQFMAGHEDDSSRLNCNTIIPGTFDISASADVKVYYGPTITCEPTAAYIGDKNIYLSCTVRARPGVTQLFWMLDGNGTIVAEGEVVNEYWIINMDQGTEGLRTKLYLRETKAESFRTYTIVAKNNVDKTTHRVKLRQLIRDTTPRPQTIGGHEQKYHSNNNRKNNRPGYVFIQNTGPRLKITSWAVALWITWAVSHSVNLGIG